MPSHWTVGMRLTGGVAYSAIVSGLSVGHYEVETTEL